MLTGLFSIKDKDRGTGMPQAASCTAIRLFLVAVPVLVRVQVQVQVQVQQIAPAGQVEQDMWAGMEKLTGEISLTTGVHP